MPTHRMHRGLVALSASAVAAIYMAGYLRTQAADASIEAATPPTPVAAVAAPPLAAPPTVTPVSRITPTYRDGTYTGQGTSRRGDVWVSVQIQIGRASCRERV